MDKTREYLVNERVDQEVKKMIQQLTSAYCVFKTLQRKFQGHSRLEQVLQKIQYEISLVKENSLVRCSYQKNLRNKDVQEAVNTFNDIFEKNLVLDIHLPDPVFSLQECLYLYAQNNTEESCLPIRYRTR